MCKQEQISLLKLPEFMLTNCIMLGTITKIYLMGVQNFKTYTMIL